MKQYQVRSELNAVGSKELVRRLREIAVADRQPSGGLVNGVSDVAFRRALREATLPLTEHDMRCLFAHFQACGSIVVNEEYRYPTGVIFNTGKTEPNIRFLLFRVLYMV